MATRDHTAHAPTQLPGQIWVGYRAHQRIFFRLPGAVAARRPKAQLESPSPDRLGCQAQAPGDRGVRIATKQLFFSLGPAVELEAKHPNALVSTPLAHRSDRSAHSPGRLFIRHGAQKGVFLSCPFPTERLRFRNAQSATPHLDRNGRDAQPFSQLAVRVAAQELLVRPGPLALFCVTESADTHSDAIVPDRPEASLESASNVSVGHRAEQSHLLGLPGELAGDAKLAAAPVNHSQANPQTPGDYVGCVQTQQSVLRCRPLMADASKDRNAQLAPAVSDGIQGSLESPGNGLVRLSA